MKANFDWHYISDDCGRLLKDVAPPAIDGLHRIVEKVQDEEFWTDDNSNVVTKSGVVLTTPNEKELIEKYVKTYGHSQ